MRFFYRLKILLRHIVGAVRRSAYVLIKDGDRFLLVQESKGLIRGLWGLPGGGIKRKEEPEKSAEREAEEEIGYNIKITGKLNELRDKENKSIRHIFIGEIVGGELKIRKSEIKDAKWFTLEEIGNMKGKLRGEWVFEAVKSSVA